MQLTTVKANLLRMPIKLPAPRPLSTRATILLSRLTMYRKKFNPQTQLEAGQDNRLVRQGNKAVAKQYEQEGYQPRPVKGLIEQGQSKEVILRPKGEVMKVEKPEPVPVPPKKEEQEEKFEKKLERVQLADIDAIVESYAQRVAEKKLGERMEGSNLATRWFVRLAEDGGTIKII